MNFKQITGIYFSPTEHTKKVVELIAGRIHGNRTVLDLTDAGKRPDYHFTEDEAVIVGVPVYGGRVPETAEKRLRKLHGRNTPAVLVVTYGNRAYEDALAELRDVLSEQGFQTVAAAAVVTEHNILRGIATGRPDAADEDALRQFGKKVDDRLRTVRSACRIGEVAVKGNVPYRAYGTVPFKIKVSGGCSRCGLCIKKCPVQAISRTDPKVTDQKRCISCMRCVKVCPMEKRKISPFILYVAGKKLKKACDTRKEPEFFF